MYRKLTETERQERRAAFRKNPIYRILYTPLWKQRGNDLAPEDVWVEANNLASKLKTIDKDCCDMIVAEEFADLCDRYANFVNGQNEVIKRDFSQSEHSAMMVSLVAFLLLVNIYPEAKGHPYLKVCQALTNVSSDIKGYTEIYEEARRNEDMYEERGEFIEVADFIEQIMIRDTQLSSSEKEYAKKVVGQIVEETRTCHYDTLKENEVILSRVNDKNDHCFQSELNQLRAQIRKAEEGEEECLEYENIIFDEKYKDRISDIRNAILPFIGGGVDHIDPTKQNQWLAIIEPLKLIGGLLIVHRDKPKRKECTNDEICRQMEVFFADKVKTVEFSKIPKSISDERSVWKDKRIGLTLADWDRYLNSPGGERKYKLLATVAKRVYGEVVKVLRR